MKIFGALLLVSTMAMAHDRIIFWDGNCRIDAIEDGDYVLYLTRCNQRRVPVALPQTLLPERHIDDHPELRSREEYRPVEPMPQYYPQEIQ